MTTSMAYPRLKRHYSIVAHSSDVVELRYGVWNPVSFTVTDDSSSGHLLGILNRLDGRFSTAEIAEEEGIAESDVQSVVERLAELDLLEKESTHALDYYLDQIVPRLSVQERKKEMLSRSVVLLGDEGLLEQISRVLEASLLPGHHAITMADESFRTTLRGDGQSWSNDSLALEEGAEAFEKWKESLVIFGVNAVNPLEMRAFNRLSLHYRIPWIHAAVDGPYLFIGPTFTPFRSPCYECMEARLVMNMRESASYQRYKGALAEGRAEGVGAPLDAVLGAMVGSMTAFEALNFLLTGTSFTDGKLMSIYLPTMEIAFNEVLRLPGCLACSPAPERDDRELYFDVRTLFGDES